MLECACEGWQKGAAAILSAQKLAAMHGVKYSGDAFKFCPWCGVILATKEDEPHKIEDVWLISLE